MAEKRMTMTGRLKPGMELKKDYTVAKGDTAHSNGSGDLEVLATPVLLTWLENAAYEMAALCLPDYETTVGVRMVANHIAATPIGMKVRVKTILKEVDERRIVFSFEAWDKVQRICYGDHERFVVDKTPFMKKILEKKDN